MARIQKMDKHLTNMIAAGEVVERPMGIVKEVVENSIDANATRIEVHIKQGGIESLEIIDNGIGMDKEDALMAFERHATSKIKTTEDLWEITTMGFRGEALPSIASVSQVELRTNNGIDSTRVYLEYGEVKKVEPYACNQGTEILIKGLFERTPARLKHLKTPQYETALISDIMSKFALSHPNIAFRLVVDGKETLKTTGKDQLKEVLYQVYSKEVFNHSIDIDKENYDARCYGLVVLPQINRATRNYITLYINKRMINSFKLSKAVIDAYGEYMPHGRYPIAVIHIELDEHLIDVNVHPSKWEVRLSKENQLFLLVNEAVKEALAKHHTAPQVEKLTPTTTYFEQKELFIPQMQEEKKNYTTTISADDKQDESTHNTISAVNKPDVDSIVEPTIKEEIKSIVEEEVVVKKRVHFLNLVPLAQLNKKYILASSEEGLVILDQHAAQERVHYEKIRASFENKNSENINLLVPLSIEVGKNIIIRLEEINEAFEDLGLKFEVFADNTIIIRAIPVWMQGMQEEQVLQDILDFIVEEKTINKSSLNKDKLATKACHRSIRFNRSLTMDEMRKVIEDLEYCIQPYHCPHGRPVMITISEAQLIKEFKR